MEGYSYNRQTCEEFKDIKICKVPSGKYSIYKGDTLIGGGFVSAKFVPSKDYTLQNEYKFIVCKTSVYDEDREEYLGIWDLYDINGNKLLGNNECTSISLPNISARNYDDKAYGKPYGKVYGDNIFIIEHRHWNAELHYSLVLPNGIAIYNSDSIKILDNHTILVNKLKEDKSVLKGLFDWDGNEILPVEYKHIKHISQYRYKIGRENYFLIINQKGEKLTENFLTILNFESLHDSTQERLFAIVYKNKELKDNGKWYFKDGGVIDIDGNEILPYTYDKITLYPPHYALCVRKGIRSIADLSNGKQIRYPNLKIKHTWGIDVLGRCIFSEDCTYDGHEEEWKDGTRGVFDINGVLIPSGKYSQIILEDTGLMIVGVNNPNLDNDNKNDEYSLKLLWGVVDPTGKEIISPKYSKISQIRGAYLLVYKGKNSAHCNRMYEGIWAIMNMSEELVKEFDSSYEAQSYLQELDKSEGVENCPSNTSTNYYYEVPKVLLSEAIKSKETRSPVYYDDQFDDEEDLGRSKYGEYNGWDDNTIDEAFDGNPELTWNID